MSAVKTFVVCSLQFVVPIHPYQGSYHHCTASISLVSSHWANFHSSIVRQEKEVKSAKEVERRQEMWDKSECMGHCRCGTDKSAEQRLTICPCFPFHSASFTSSEFAFYFWESSLPSPGALNHLISVKANSFSNCRPFLGRLANYRFELKCANKLRFIVKHDRLCFLLDGAPTQSAPKSKSKCCK